MKETARPQPQRLRVALIALHFAEYAGHLAQAMASQAEVMLVVYRGNADNELGNDWQEWLAVPHLRTLILDRPKNAIAVLSNTRRLIYAVKGFRPSLIHYQEDIRDELILSLPFFSSYPKVLTVHDPLPHSGVDARRFRFSRLRLYQSWMRRSAHAAIAHGEKLAALLEQQCPMLLGKVTGIDHGPLGLRDAPPTSTVPTGMRLLFFGRIHQYKGLANFVAAVISLRREGLQVIGVVAGKGSDLDIHRETMAQAGGFEILDHYIPAREVPHLFDQSRAVVLPYIDGTQSGVAALALGHGRPVIATAVGSIPELVRHGQNGLLVAPGDAEALKSAIRSVVLDDRLWTTLTRGALALRDGALSWQSISTKTLAVYASALSRVGTENRD